MSVINKLINYFPTEIYPSVNDISSDLYKLLNAVAASFETYYDSVANLRKQIIIKEATGYLLSLVGNSYNVNMFRGEDESTYKLRFMSMTGMDKPTLTGMYNIVRLFTNTAPVFEEVGDCIINITIPNGGAYPAYFYQTIGTDGSYGSSIGDTYPESAGVIYADVRSAITVSKTYLENIIADVKPAGIVINLLEGA